MVFGAKQDLYRMIPGKDGERVGAQETGLILKDKKRTTPITDIDSFVSLLLSRKGNVNTRD